MDFRAPSSGLEKQLLAKLESRKSNSIFRQLVAAPKGSIDFSSNDFLSLSTSPELRTAFLAELARHRNFPLGSGGSRLLDGNSDYADSLEREVAKFHNAPSGLLWTSGFDANSGLFACVPQPGDVILYDELIHASVHDGMKLSRAAKKIPFKHNSVDDLVQVIQVLLHDSLELSSGSVSIFVAVESVYSMDGDLAPLQEIEMAVSKCLPCGNGHIIIDEAHGTGVLGPSGAGLVCDLGLEDKIFARLHTFGKSLACSGAVILCSPIVRSYLINYARPLIYTTFMPFPLLAAIKASYSLLQSGHTEKLKDHLYVLIRYCHEALLQVTNRMPAYASIINVSNTCPKSPIFSLVTDHPRSLAKYCQDGGFIVRAVVPPTVPTRRVRVCLHAGNTRGEVDRLIQRIEDWLLMKTKDGRFQSTTVFEKAHI